MIKRLQRKLIIVSTLSLALVLTILLTVVNLVNFFHIDNSAKNTLTWLAQNGGEFPNPDKGLPSAPLDNTSEPEPSQVKRPKDFSPETPFASRYFSVQFLADAEKIPHRSTSLHSPR